MTSTQRARWRPSRAGILNVYQYEDETLHFAGGRLLLRDAGDGATVAAIRASGEPGRFFGWATPLLRRQVRRSISADLERLRAVLEN